MPNKLFIATLLTLFTASFLLTYMVRDYRLNSDTGFMPFEGERAVLLIYETMSPEELIAALSPDVTPEIRSTDIPPAPALPFSDDASEISESETVTQPIILATATPQIHFSPEHLLWASDQLSIRTFRPGRYVIEGGESFSSLMGRMLRGEEDPGRIVIQPGQTYERFFNRVSTQFRFTPDELQAAMTDSAWIVDQTGLAPHLLFGRMIPNTYEMFWTTTPEAFINRMLTEFDRAIAPIQDQIEASGMTVDEILTFASIVELEARYDNEKPRIAGLYHNRINRRMRLQADPTVNYALGRRGRLTVRDYRFEHPYNTYRINGLPPGPITNPAISSIRAVVEPEEHDYIFMVANPEGFHNFSRTYAEHQRRVAQWRSWLREQDAIRAQNQ